MAQIVVTQIKSTIGSKPKHRGTIRALGLGRIGRSKVHEDTPVIRGMIHAVSHLVEVKDHS
jgi:large subunit ribosomal protein L30